MSMPNYKFVIDLMWMGEKQQQRCLFA